MMHDVVRSSFSHSRSSNNNNTNILRWSSLILKPISASDLILLVTRLPITPVSFSELNKFLENEDKILDKNTAYGNGTLTFSAGNDGDKVNSTIAGKGKKKHSQRKGFHAFSLSKPVLGGIMRIGFKMPTPIQRKTILL